jgi:hypothetical protein
MTPAGCTIDGSDPAFVLDYHTIPHSGPAMVHVTFKIDGDTLYIVHPTCKMKVKPATIAIFPAAIALKTEKKPPISHTLVFPNNLIN